MAGRPLRLRCRGTCAVDELVSFLSVEEEQDGEEEQDEADDNYDSGVSQSGLPSGACGVALFLDVACCCAVVLV